MPHPGNLLHSTTAALEMKCAWAFPASEQIYYRQEGRKPCASDRIRPHISETGFQMASCNGPYNRLAVLSMQWASHHPLYQLLHPLFSGPARSNPKVFLKGPHKSEHSNFTFMNSSFHVKFYILMLHCCFTFTLEHLAPKNFQLIVSELNCF